MTFILFARRINSLSFQGLAGVYSDVGSGLADYRRIIDLFEALG
jgi:hypothetical protein